MKATILSFGLAAPFCVVAAISEGNIQVKLAELSKEYNEEVTSLKPRLAALANSNMLSATAIRYLKSHGANVSGISQSSLHADQPETKQVRLHHRAALEMTSLEFDFSEREVNKKWSYCLKVKVSARISSTVDGSIFASDEVDRFDCRPLTTWLQDGTIEEAALDLFEKTTEYLVDEMLLRYRKDESGESPLHAKPPVVPDFKYWYRFSYDKPKFHSDFRSYWGLNFTEVGANPRLEWTELEDVRASNVRYDFRVWKGDIHVRAWVAGFSGDKPSGQVVVPRSLVYRRDSLVQNWHEVEEPLHPCNWYFWDVRARYNLDGNPRVSDWSFIRISSRNGPDGRSKFPIRTLASSDNPDCWNKEVDYSIRKRSD